MNFKAITKIIIHETTDSEQTQKAMLLEAKTSNRLTSRHSLRQNGSSKPLCLEVWFSDFYLKGESGVVLNYSNCHQTHEMTKTNNL